MPDTSLRKFFASIRIVRCCLIISLLFAGAAQAQTWTNAYVRGTSNNWLSTAMTKNATTGLWETQQTFSGVASPRFKVSRYTDNWNEAYPAADYAITTGDGDYKITFNETSKAITLTAVPVTISANSICYNNTNNFATPYIYFWNPTPAVLVTPTPAWPGKLLTKRGNYYCYDFATALTGTIMPTSMGVIFSNNGATQSANLTYTGAGCYDNGTWKTLAQCGYLTTVPATSSSSRSSIASSSLNSSSSSKLSSLSTSASSITSSALSSSSKTSSASSLASSSTLSSSASSAAVTKTTIYFKNTLAYATPYVHYFNVVPAIVGSTWPGVAMKNLNNGWYSYEFASTVNSAGIIFDNNGAPQTANLVFTAPLNCYNNGVWQTAVACGAPVITANAGVDRKANQNTRQVLSAAASVGEYATATWTSPAWTGTLTGTQVITPVLTQLGTFNVTLTLTTATGQAYTDTLVLNVVAATQGLPERPQLAATLGFPITGSVSSGKYRFVKAFPNLDAQFPSPVLTLADGVNDLIYVVDKIGTISVFPNKETVTLAEVKTVLNISTVVRNNHEMGLLSMAFDSSYATNGFIYVYYVYGTDDSAGINGVASGDTILERWTVNDPRNPSGVVAGSKVEILRIPQVGPDHKGGMMQFHPSEGYLYLGVGDGGYGNSAFPQNPVASDPRTNNSSQDTTNLRGKFIRIKVLATPGSDGKYYQVPVDNPYVGVAGFSPEIWSYGHRNPWRWAFDKQAPYTLWETEVGQHDYEEVNLIKKGKNYGWPVCEGLNNRGALGGNAAKNCSTDYEPPADGEVNNEGKSIIGGFVYRGNSLPGLNGAFIFGDYVTKRIWSILPGAKKALVSDAFPENIASFGTDLAGENIFVTSYGIEYAAQGARSAIYKIVDDNAVAAVIPAKLSATGIFANLATLMPANGVIEYSVNTQGWFDGLKARHFIAVPNDKTIGFDPTATWDLPIGTVLVKHLTVDAIGNANKPFTTAVLFRQAAGWQAANYRWNATGTDADLVTTTVTEADGGIINRLHDVQTPADCAACHVGSGSKNPLGLHTRELNRDNNYQGVAANQLTVFNSIGLFTTAINAATSYSKFAAADDSAADINLRARSYLSTNCAHCHASSFMDMRFDTSLESMRLVGVGATDGNQRVKPFDHAHSLVYIYQTTDQSRMPRGSRYTNPAAEPMIAQWINAATAVKTGVNLRSTQTQADVGSSITLSLDDVYSNGFWVPTTSTVTWVSSNPAVLSLSGSAGSLTSTAATAGTTSITATSGGFSKTITLTINALANPATGLQITGMASLKLISGETQQLVTTATIATKLTGVTSQTTWSSSNAAVASVSATGLITGGATAGTATITASYSGLTAIYTVTNVGAAQYVYFKKPAAWAVANLHAFSITNGVTTTHSGAWPGVLMADSAPKYGSAWLRAAIPKTWSNTTGDTNVIFSNNGATQGATLLVNQSKPSWVDTTLLAAAPALINLDTGTQIQVGNGTVSIASGDNMSGKLFIPGTVVDIKANPVGPGMKFVRWEGTGAPYLLSTTNANTQMVVGSALSLTLLAVFDSITDTHVAARAQYQSLGCSGCHGSDGKGTPSLIGMEAKYTAATLASFIATNMPKGNVGACTGTCASSIAAMILDNAFLAPAGVCNATSLDDLVPQDRGFRLLTALEYNNSIRDLLGLSANLDLTTGRIPADIAVNGFKTNANGVFTNDYAKGYVLAAETAAAMVPNIYALAPSCSTVTCFVQTFGKRAYRRPLTTVEVNDLVALQSTQGNIGMLTAIFSSPAMLYRSEVGVANGAGYFQLSNYEIASLLSYTYWATTPDAALMTAADSGLLSTPAQISAKVTQMLQDPKAKVAFERFITGWLDLDKDIKTTAISTSLKADMKAETVEFVKRTVFEGGTYNTLLNAKYSYMTQQLATHYGLTWPGGTGLQRVDYTGTSAQRSGILGHAGILAIQSASEKTHPIKRGLFVRRNLMCQDFPPPPVGAVLKPQEDPSLTVRERFETTHVKAECKACHQYIDGIGFGLENYNALGLYVNNETTDNGLVKAINSLGYIGSLNSAETFVSESEPVVTYQGMDQLAGLISNSTNGKACYARQWYRYTRGQHEEVADSCTVKVFGEAFKASPNATMLDLMIQFTQTKNYTLRK